MPLYKALAADMKSSPGWGHNFGPWVKDQWYEVEGAVRSDGITSNGFHCSEDILSCQSSILTEYLAQVEVGGDSVISGDTQVWQWMRVVKVKAWPAEKSNLVLDWLEGQCHDRWASEFPTEAALYYTKHYQGQFAAMLSVVEPLWHSLFTSGDSIAGLTRTLNLHKLKPEYTPGIEKTVRMAYLLALCLTGAVTIKGVPTWLRHAAEIRPEAWGTVRGFAEDHWATLPEL